MTEEEAREAVRSRVGAEVTDRLDLFAGMVLAENGRQNLIAPATTAVIWSRHILDSIQLLALAPADWAMWLDIGTGGGFPGMAIAVAAGRAVTMVEPRRRRAAFLETAAADLGLSRAAVIAGKVEKIVVKADVISARAVASLEKLLPAAQHCATTATTWILPRGQIGDDELAQVRRSWKGMFHVEPSVTDARSAIVVATGVEAR